MPLGALIGLVSMTISSDEIEGTKERPGSLDVTDCNKVDASYSLAAERACQCLRN